MSETVGLTEDQDFESSGTNGELDSATEGSDEGDLPISGSSGPVQMNKNDRSIAEYYRWYKEGRIILDPDWQRGYLWDTKRASKLIESLLMNIPIPVIYLSENSEHNYEVIDGVQRLTSLFKFLDNEFSLSDLEYMQSLKGQKFVDLDKKIQNKLRDQTIRAFELASSTNKDMLFIIFERLNTGGVRLNEMEIRNCIYRGQLNNLIKNLANDQNLVECVNQRNLAKRMDDRSLVLRFLAFDDTKYQRATGGLKRFLNEFFEENRNPTERQIARFRERFKNAMKCCRSVFGNNGFRLRRQTSRLGGEWAPRPNATIFQVISVSMADYNYHSVVERSDAILEEYIDLISTDQKWLDAVTKSTGDASNISYSFEIWQDRMKAVMATAMTRDRQRIFSKRLKEELWNQDKSCAICHQEIKLINDAALDHDIHYWRGGRTVPENARLVHRICNLKRPN